MIKSRKRVKALSFGSLLSGVLLLTPGIAISEPNGKSVAEIQGCLEDSATAHVCSTKELSNVVVQCDNGDGTSFFFKYDDLDDPESPHVSLLVSAFEGLFACPAGEPVLAVFVKSGSAKHAGEPIAGLLPGSGALWSPASCPVDCPTPDDGGDGDGGGGIPQ